MTAEKSAPLLVSVAALELALRQAEAAHDLDAVEAARNLLSIPEAPLGFVRVA